MKDQSEYEAENRQLDAKARTLRAELASKTGETMAAPALPADDCLAANEILTAHVAMLESKLASANKSPSPAQAKKQTMTERVLAARGVRTLAELNSLPANARD